MIDNDDILTGFAAAALIAGAVYYGIWPLYKIGRPTKQAAELLNNPELQGARAKADASLKDLQAASKIGSVQP